MKANESFPLNPKLKNGLTMDDIEKHIEKVFPDFCSERAYLTLSICNEIGYKDNVLAERYAKSAELYLSNIRQ